MNNDIPDDALLSTKELSRALTQRGFQVSASTLATMRTRGGGPEFQKFGPYVRYTWGTSLPWARARLSPIVSSTSELHAVNPAA